MLVKYILLFVAIGIAIAAIWLTVIAFRWSSFIAGMVLLALAAMATAIMVYKKYKKRAPKDDPMTDHWEKDTDMTTGKTVYRHRKTGIISGELFDTRLDASDDRQYIEENMADSEWKTLAKQEPLSKNWKKVIQNGKLVYKKGDKTTQLRDETKSPELYDDL